MQPQKRYTWVQVLVLKAIPPAAGLLVGILSSHMAVTSEKYDLGVTNCHIISLEKPVPAIHPYDRTSASTLLVSPSDFDHQSWNELFYKGLEAAEGHFESFTLKYGIEELDRKQVASSKLQGLISMYIRNLLNYT